MDSKKSASFDVYPGKPTMHIHSVKLGSRPDFLASAKDYCLKVSMQGTGCRRDYWRSLAYLLRRYTDITPLVSLLDLYARHHSRSVTALISS